MKKLSPRQAWAIVPATGLVAAAVALPGGTARADASINANQYDLSVESDAIEVAIASPFLPVVSSVSSGSYGAAATLNSLGQSTAAAGAPYSPVLYSLPLTVAGLAAGKMPNIPTVPGYVQASYPTKESDSQIQPGYQITADADASQSEGRSQLGQSQPGTSVASGFATALTQARPDGSVFASGSSGAVGLVLGGILELGEVSSRVEMTAHPGAAADIVNRTNLGTVTVLKLPSGIQDGTFRVGGFNTNVSLTPDVIPTLNKMLEPSGMKLDYVPSSYMYADGSTSEGAVTKGKSPLSIESGGLRVTFTRDLESQGRQQVSYTIGRVGVSAAVTGVPSASVDTGTPLAPSGGVTPGAAAPTAALPDTAASPGAVPAGTSPGQIPTANIQVAAPARNEVARAFDTSSADAIYPVLFFGGLAALVAAQLFRVAGVRRLFGA
jgi:hypothetical protein